ncbi:hypothetical protein LOAG_17813 [Loa loa]|uniref:Uncharacterized protein n=1 Tax=Loa loa TaxID=7209 RepID=A0A1S0UGW8_LOALO|nr:hypothetical protein LOAG_17813 [Loa loa]EJD74950.1 hypothetical protein LOAG_17813 [Loa loa]
MTRIRLPVTANRLHSKMDPMIYVTWKHVVPLRTRKHEESRIISAIPFLISFYFHANPKF